MAAESLVELYRFNEGGGTYDACCTLVYPDPSVCYVKGLDSPITTAHWRELKRYLTDKGCKEAKFLRKGVWKMIPLTSA